LLEENFKTIINKLKYILHNYFTSITVIIHFPHLRPFPINLGDLLGVIDIDIEVGSRFGTMGEGSASTSIALSVDKSSAASSALTYISTTSSIG